MSQLFTSGGQSTGVSASTSVLPMNTQDRFPLGWTGWISLQTKGLSRVFSNTTVQKHRGEANSSDPGGLKSGLVQGEPRAVILSLGPVAPWRVMSLIKQPSRSSLPWGRLRPPGLRSRSPATTL